MDSTPAEKTPKGLAALWPIILITALFFFWGMANNLNDILIPQFKKAFTLTDFESGFVQSFFYIGYFLFALPAGFFIRRFGYKAAVVVGLLLFATGALMFYPASQAGEYRWFLGALFVIASGLAFLETSANPLITVLGAPEKAAFRLNLAQSFNPLGSLAGIWIGQNFILSGKEPTAEFLSSLGEAGRHAFYLAETRAVQTPYLLIGVGILLWAGLVWLSRFPSQASRAAKNESAEIGASEAFFGLFRYKHFLMGVVAQFFYVGAQVGIWSYTIRYAQHEIHITDKAAATYVSAALILFWLGRVVGTALMSRLSAVKLLSAFALINIALTGYAAVAGGQYGLYALVATSFFMSIMFPTIFATSLQGLGILTKTGASLLVMSIIGGAVLTAVMGYISDISHIRTAIFVPLACFAVIALYGFGSKSAKVDMTKGH
ncbi:MAG: L-fucose:H+ symporter permease [Asticcacaulis sp.]|uniref:L-fucose:H+ symporter permease n=1 Tax=Asticcacaulis sp. TaxID=1872648 RepID=UPI0039E3B53C